MFQEVCDSQVAQPMGKEKGKWDQEKMIKREAASSKNLRDPNGMAHGFSLYLNKAKRTPLSPFWTETSGVFALIFQTLRFRIREAVADIAQCPGLEDRCLLRKAGPSL